MGRYSKIKKLLIANRGEIARRVHRACAALGIKTVLVVSEPDAAALATHEVEQVVSLGDQLLGIHILTRKRSSKRRWRPAAMLFIQDTDSSLRTRILLRQCSMQG